MATTEAGGNGFEYLSDPIDRYVCWRKLGVLCCFGRFPLPDLVGGDCPPDGDPVQTLAFAAADSSIGDVGDAALTVQLGLNSTCDGLSLSAPDSEQSTGKDDPHAPGWTKSLTRASHGLIGWKENYNKICC